MIRRNRFGLTISVTLVAATALAAPMASASSRSERYQSTKYPATQKAPSNIPDGTILSSKPVTVRVIGIPTNVTAWQLSYESTDATGAPVQDIATVLLPDKPAATSPRPLLSYQVAEDSVNASCAPSNELQLGVEIEEPLIAAGLEQGWAVVVPDYEGPRSQFTAGAQAGHAVLDGIRAAESFAPAGLSGAATPVGMWGYSGGALATSWASELEPSYAPELTIKGVAEGGVPDNIGDVARQIDGGPFAAFYLAATVSLADAYPSLVNFDSVFSPAGDVMRVGVRSQCVETLVASFAFQRIEAYTWWWQDPLQNPGVQQIIALDALGQRKPVGPLFIYQSLNDEIIPFAGVDALAAKYCGEGVPVQFIKDEASEHIALAVTGAGAAVNYLIDRFAGVPAPNTCATGGTTVTSALVQPPNNLVQTLTILAGLTGFV